MADNWPCENCTRVKAPDKCENKNCSDWVKWFRHKWEAVRRLWQT